MNKTGFIKSLCFGLGLLLNAFGIRLIVFAALGTYPIDGVAVALYNIFGLSVGIWLNIDSVILVLAAAFIAGEKPNLYCFAVSVLFGFLYDFWSIVLFDSLSAFTFSIGVRTALFVLGAVINAVGASIYLCPGWPVSALDNLMLSVKNRFNLSFQKSRLLMEACIAVVAFVLGGPLGLGTLVLVLLFSSALEVVHKLILKKYAVLIGR